MGNGKNCKVKGGSYWVEYFPSYFKIIFFSNKECSDTRLLHVLTSVSWVKFLNANIFLPKTINQHRETLALDWLQKAIYLYSSPRLLSQIRTYSKTLFYNALVKFVFSDPLGESEILANEPLEFDKNLEKWLPKKGNWLICWRATRDGWAASTFHSKCDGKKPTLTIVQVPKDNKSYVFGGYATESWENRGKFEIIVVYYFYQVFADARSHCAFNCLIYGVFYLQQKVMNACICLLAR